MRVRMKEVIKSNKGFYVGDICYVLNKEHIYHGIWGKAGYRYGKHSTPDGFSFAVAGTAYGDGCYPDKNYKYFFGVDSGSIGVVPFELVSSFIGGAEFGELFEGGGEATFEADDGLFCITLPSGEKVEIQTALEEW